ncbi:MAG TPA: DNA-binding protein [Staphylococcus sp.]|uniref:DNA-binding protein n=1 Tax=Mammaliicoccus vitulinus TaxID=71237 RepID=UPI000E695995|nr:DNA-binding protein [Mammaliicoccus vitulinus]RIN15280.1 DNA-binding protein [Mammaliicoccus vitulinus]HAL10609.1 DNA-binding protein [Staphylococcus sp.]
MSYFKKLALIGMVSIATLSTEVAYAGEAPVIGDDNSKGQVLVDNTHGQTAGAADWVIDGAFSDYANSIANQGYQVKELRDQSGITADSLIETSILVIPEANIPFKSTEQQAILDYVKNGGSVIFISDHYNADRNYNRIDSSEIMNGYRRGAYDDITKNMTEAEKNSEAMQGVTNSDWLSENFGVRFRYNALNNVKATDIVQGEEGLGLGEGVQSVSMHAGSTLAVTNPKIAKGIAYLPDNLTEADKWGHAVDQGVYNGGGKEEGAYIAVSKVGKGKAAFIGDSSMVEDITPKYKREDNGSTKKTYDGFKEEDNGKLLNNLTTWLGKKEDYTTFEALGITLDQETTLLDSEIPENSKETQAEPWSQPKDGYEWFNSETFAPGSYGGPENAGGDDDNPGNNQGTATLEYPESVVSGETFKVTTTLNGYDINSTINDLKLGMYTEGGQQIGKISLDGQQASNYGYSQPTAVKTDGEGNAQVTFTVEVKEGVSGNANIRLKQGSTNVVTKPVTVQP